VLEGGEAKWFVDRHIDIVKVVVKDKGSARVLWRIPTASCPQPTQGDLKKTSKQGKSVGFFLPGLFFGFWPFLFLMPLVCVANSKQPTEAGPGLSAEGAF
jgi:hypothetical protein